MCGVVFGGGVLCGVVWYGGVVSRAFWSRWFVMVRWCV
jgi:hypothetical protein